MYFVYILRCADQTLYVGFTHDLKRRLHQHNHAKQGARYTKTRRPVVLVYFERFRLQRKALQREYEIKSWSRAKKLALVAAKKKRRPRAKSLTAQELQDDKNTKRHADAATTQPD